MQSQSLLSRLMLIVAGMSTVLGASLSRAQSAYPLADKIPADSVVYLGWAGGDSLQGAYATSDLAAFIGHTNLQAVAGDVIPKLFAKMAEQSDDKQTADAFHATLPLLWKHPCAFYVANVSIKNDGTPTGDAVLLCDPGNDSGELLKDFQTLVNAGHLALVTRGSLIGIAAEHLTSPEPTSFLATAPTFVAAMKALQSSPALAIYIDGKSLLTHCDESAAKDADAATIWPKVKEILGLDGFDGLAVTAGFDHGNWTTASSLQAPLPRKGLFAVIEPKPIDPLLLARVPASAMSVSVTNFDAAMLFDTIASAMAVTPKGDKTFHQAVGLATLGLGRNLRKQILGTLGPQWVVYSDATTHGPVVLNHPNDPDGASDGLVSSFFGLVNLANNQIPGANKNPVVTADQSTVKGVDLTSATTKWVAPTFAVKGKVLYLGMAAEPVVLAANTPATADGKDILHSDGFTAALKRLGTSNYVSFDYADIPQSTPAALGSLTASSKQLHDILGSLGIDYPQIDLPKAADLKGHLSPALSVQWADATGVYSKSISPFPGSDMLLGDPQKSLLGVGSVSLVAGVALPAVAKAREQARRVQNMSNERQICMALFMYANDHNGAFPPDLASCSSYLGGKTGMRVFVDPQTNNSVPAEVLNGTDDARAAWVKDHADYVLLLPNQKMSELKNAGSTAAIAPRDAEKSTKPVGIGFADGHVEMCTPDRVHDLLHLDGGL